MLARQLNTLNKFGFNPLFAHLPDDKNIHGVCIRDTGSGYAYERTGALAEFSADHLVPDSVLPINSGMRRCILSSSGNVVYYTDPDNSMFVQDKKDGINVDVIAVNIDVGATQGVVTVSTFADASNIGCVLMLSDDDGTREWYAMIQGVDGYDYIVANPILEDWGYGADGKVCNNGIIGNAKLDGSDGQFMVEVPAFYWRRRIVLDGEDILDYREISLKPMAGATYSPMFYHSVTEGVNTDSEGNPVDGWTGVWHPVEQAFTDISYTPLGSKFLSVCGFLPRTYVQIGEVRSRCANVGQSFHQKGFYNNLALQYLMIVEAASFQTQAKYGNGVTSWTSTNWDIYNGSRPIRRGGDTIQSGNHSWDMSKAGPMAKMPAQAGTTIIVGTVSFRGIENPWGHLFDWIDGYNLRYIEPDGDLGLAVSYVTEDPALFSNTILAEHTPLPDVMETSRWDGEKWVGGNRYWRAPSAHMLPTVHTPSSTAYIGDYLYVDTAPPAAGVLRVLAVGGYSSLSSLAGAFCVLVGRNSGYRSSTFGGRLCAKI